MNIRRVVTGTHDGKSVFVSDGPVEPATVALMPGLEFHSLWGADQPVALPTNGTRPEAPRYFPPVGGFRFQVVTIPPEPPGGAPPVDPARATAEVEEKLPGLLAHMEPDSPGMHTTDTIDWDFVLSGEIFLELDDGAEVHLHAGDCVIQNGTRHAWHNRSSEPCVLAVALVGAARAVQEV
jgi:hypothetical protein